MRVILNSVKLYDASDNSKLWEQAGPLLCNSIYGIDCISLRLLYSLYDNGSVLSDTARSKQCFPEQLYVEESF